MATRVSRTQWLRRLNGLVLSQKFVDPVQVQNDALIAEQQANAQAVVANGGDDRPLFAQDAGQFFGDLGKNVINPVAALARTTSIWAMAWLMLRSKPET